ncbi:MAG: hypothetical protein KatS3mg008_1987 [Acidimicrobiales bacterium]|nr:MAG: hypothetical protein KatS3mg008_1987 [Acidimicrobiales bacterium]
MVPRRSNRWVGPVVVAALVLLVGVAVFTGGKGGGGSDSKTTTTRASGSEGAPEPTGRMPITYAEAEAQGRVDEFDWGGRCDTETGRLKLPSIYAPPCVPVFEGDNGGATYQGVTEDTIKIVRYVPQENANLQALIASFGVRDTAEQVKETFDGYLEIYQSLFETYGRRVEVVDFQGSGQADDEVASRADAVEIAEEIKPFAVLGAPALDRGVFAQELARRKIVCIGCGTALPESVIQDNQPYIWVTGQTPDQFLELLYVWLREVDRRGPELGVDTEKAIFAGDERFHDRKRKVGVIHFEQDPPIFTELAERETGRSRRDIALRETYLFDLATMPDRATELIAKMKSQEITTIVFIGDPIMPTYLTQAATKQEYFPEWVIVGGVLVDTNVMGRVYDQKQWRHAFGLSLLPAKTPRELTPAWRVWEWWFGKEKTPPPAQGTFQLVANEPAQLLLGIHMAGPDLTPDTFARGLFRVPPTGGGPTAPQISYGDWGFFPQRDFAGIDDATVIWWDPDAEGENELGVKGKGMWRYADEGRRFTTKKPIAPILFEREGTRTIFEELPAGDRPRDYPRPARTG